MSVNIIAASWRDWGMSRKLCNNFQITQSLFIKNPRFPVETAGSTAGEKEKFQFFNRRHEQIYTSLQQSE
jgi:hypothetical protein